jgi:GAF domain-containing protein
VLPAAGWIECGPKPVATTTANRELLTTLVTQASTAIENVALTVQLGERLEELRASRARIVAAADAERRRIERDLHGRRAAAGRRADHEDPAGPQRRGARRVGR